VSVLEHLGTGISQSKKRNGLSILSPVVDEERMMLRSLVGFSAWSFLQCFVSAGWVTARISPKILLLNMLSENWLVKVHLENGD